MGHHRNTPPAVARREPSHTGVVVPVDARSSVPHTARELMKPLTYVPDEFATIGEAAAILARRDLRELVVVSDDGMVIGIVSSQDIVKWLANNNFGGTTDREGRSKQG